MTETIKLYGGIEGGGTKTILSFFDENGSIIATGQSGPSNPWILSQKSSNGFMESAVLLDNLVNETFNNLSNVKYELVAVGMCLSGVGTQLAKQRLLDSLKIIHPKYKVFIGSDSLASLFTAFPNGGIVVIAGTGSNCILVNPIKFDSLNLNEQIISISSGGWGFILGDEGSAYWIAKKVIVYLIKINDNFIQLDGTEDYDRLMRLIFEYFKINSLREILTYFYSGNQNHLIASFTAKLAESLLIKLALNKQLSNFFKVHSESTIVQDVFQEAGFELACQVLALHGKIDRDLISNPKGLPIVCTGSVFKSWKFLKPGFVNGLRFQSNLKTQISKFQLVTIKTDSTIGAALLASQFSTSIANNSSDDNTTPLKFKYNDHVVDLDYIDLIVQ